MTSKEFEQITLFYRKHFNLVMRGHVWLFPKAVKQMPYSSHTVKVWADRKEHIYLKPKRMRVEGEYFRIHDPYNGVMNIHRKWVSSVLLYHFNH